MIRELAMHIVDYDPMAVARRSVDTRRYTQLVWSWSHAELIDEEQLCLFLTDERYGDLTEEQKSVARTCRDQMRAIYGAVILRLLQFDEMMRRGMIPDFRTFHDVFSPKVAEEGGGSFYIYHKAG